MFELASPTTPASGIRYLLDKLNVSLPGVNVETDAVSPTSNTTGPAAWYLFRPVEAATCLRELSGVLDLTVPSEEKCTSRVLFVIVKLSDTSAKNVTLGNLVLPAESTFPVLAVVPDPATVVSGITAYESATKSEMSPSLRALAALKELPEPVPEVAITLLQVERTEGLAGLKLALTV